MSHSSRRHRRLDVAHAEAMARDRGEVPPIGATSQPIGNAREKEGTPIGRPSLPLVSSRQRMMDLRTMNKPRVLLAKLSVRTSAKGKQYLSGWLGKASVVGFPGEADKFGNAVWDIFVSEPEGRPGTTLPDNLRERQERASAPAARGCVDLDDSIPF